MNFRKVLIAVDESKHSKRAADVGIQFARELNAEIAMIHVIPPVNTIGSIDGEIVPVDMIEVPIEVGERIIDNLTEEFGKGIQINKVVKVGDPSMKILEYANTWNAGLIVIGKHGLESFRHLIFGGVVDEVATHTQIPVLLVPFIEKK